MNRPAHVVVVGGGITGLTAAWHLRDRADVTVVEATERCGGKIETVDFGGRRVDTGPDAFIARVPDGIRLCEEVGLAGELVSPATGQAFVWTRGRVRPLPDGLVLGVPSALRPLARSGIVPPGAVARAALDLALPRTRYGTDIGVGDLVRRRMGRAVHERLADALLGGINAGRSEDLSIEAGTPQLAAVGRSSRSLLRGLAASRRSSSATDGPVFRGVVGGLDRLVDTLVAGLVESGVAVRPSTAVTGIERGSAGGYTVHLRKGEAIDTDGVVVAVPAPVAAALVAGLAPDAAETVRTIDYSSVVLTLLAYPATAFPARFTGSGYLVPRVDGRLTTAVSWASSKWAHLADPDTVLLRVSAGRWGDDRAMALDDDELVARLHQELVDATGANASRPTEALVRRWTAGFPQYRVGHLGRVAAVEASLRATAPALEVAGAAYRGLGLPACIRQGREAADRVLASVGR